MSQNYPVVLCFSGHDPSGGAGIQADIETLVSHHCHPVSVITALTEQDSCNVKKLLPQKPEDILSQARLILEDMPVTIIKIGLLAHHEVASAIAELLLQYPHIPVVLDPVLAAGGGACLSDAKLLKVIRNELLPQINFLTPNMKEARLLSDLNTLNDCGLQLLQSGCEHVLITGADEDQQDALVKNYLFSRQQLLETFNWKRLPYTYHGSGCTLASSIAGLMAHGLDPFSAVTEAQDYTWNTLDVGYKLGKGQYTPKRLFWMETT